MKTNDDLSSVFEALGNDHRRDMIRLLALKPRSISELAGIRGLSLPAIHKHVRALEAAGMVHRRKVGRTNFLAIRREPLQRLQAWTDQFSPWWGTDAESLDNYAEHLAAQTTDKEKTQ